VWSPDGSRLAFIHTPDYAGLPARQDLYVANADGSHRVRVATRLGYMVWVPPFAWAADGRRLAVTLDPTRRRPQNRDVSSTGARGELFVVNVSGGRPQRLTRSRVFDGFGLWASARRVVYVRSRPGREFPPTRQRQVEIRAVDTVTGRDRLLRRRPGGVLALVPSPDGRTAAVLEDGVSVSLLDLAGGRETPLIRRSYLTSVAWSPDAKQIALNGGSVVDVATKRLVHVARIEQECAQPDWSPGGNWLVCSVGYGEEDERRRGGSDLVLVRAGTRTRFMLTDSAKASSGRWRPLP
jgi:Tol biopolymer transport system component